MPNKKQILFVHQNFPGQYRYLAKYYSENDAWECYAVGEKACVKRQLHLIPKNIKVLGYDLPEIENEGTLGRAENFSKHVFRANALEKVLLRQKHQGLDPDVILAHPGWGEALYLKEIFPKAKLICFFEYFFSTTQHNINFDPEFSSTLNQKIHYRMVNTPALLALDTADIGVCPTHWQWSTHPKEYQNKIKIIHDGIDTDIVKPSLATEVILKDTSLGDVRLSPNDEIISYSIRNLEPSRGFHCYMRALPELQRTRPNAKFIIIGGDEVSYSSRHHSGKNWREVMLSEVGDQLDMQRTIFAGKIPYHSLLDIFSITSLHIYYTTPFVLSWSLLEAMACETPILASATQPVKEVIKNGENGVLFDFFSKKEIVDKANEMLSNSNLRSLLGKQARKTIIDNYDLNSICLPQHIELIEKQLQSN